MSKRTALDGSRRAFVARAGGLAAALVAAPRAEGTQAPSDSGSRPRDLGLWVTWYDLPQAGSAEHLAWVHDTYIPALLKRRGYLWAAHYASVVDGRVLTARERALGHTDDPAVPTGNAYVLVVGAEHSNVFGAPVPGELHAALPEADRKMLAMRISERVNVFAEAARVTGPEGKTYAGGMALAPCIQIGSFNVDFRKEEEVFAWYAQSRMPAMTTLPSCIRTRKLASVQGWAKAGILYEFTSVESRKVFHDLRRPASRDEGVVGARGEIPAPRTRLSQPRAQDLAALILRSSAAARDSHTESSRPRAW